MKITMVQSEIEAAIEASVRDQISVKEGHRVDIELRATRGDEGYQANINIVPEDAPRFTGKAPKAAKAKTASASSGSSAPATTGRGRGRRKATETTTETPVVSGTSDQEAAVQALEEEQAVANQQQTAEEPVAEVEESPLSAETVEALNEEQPASPTPEPEVQAATETAAPAPA